MVGLAKFAVSDPKDPLTRSLPLFCFTVSKIRFAVLLAPCGLLLSFSCEHVGMRISKIVVVSHNPKKALIHSIHQLRETGEKTILTSITIRGNPCCQANGQDDSSRYVHG